MSEVYVPPLRVWFKPPNKEWSNKSQWVGRTVYNGDATYRKFLSAPKEFVGNGHYDWELYHHDRAVQELVDLLRRVARSATESISMVEILDAISKYEKGSP